MISMNGKQAAIEAGYSPTSAAAQATGNLQKAHIQAYIQEAQSETLKQMGVTRHQVLLKAVEIMNSDDNDRMRAVEFLGKHLGIAQDDGGTKVAVQVNISRADAECV